MSISAHCLQLKVFRQLYQKKSSRKWKQSQVMTAKEWLKVERNNKCIATLNKVETDNDMYKNGSWQNLDDTRAKHDEANTDTFINCLL
jgi:hypothetical protein